MGRSERESEWSENGENGKWKMETAQDFGGTCDGKGGKKKATEIESVEMEPGLCVSVRIVVGPWLAGVVGSGS